MTAPRPRGRETLALIWPVCMLALLSPADSSPRNQRIDALPALML